MLTQRAMTYNVDTEVTYINVKIEVNIWLLIIKLTSSKLVKV